MILHILKTSNSNGYFCRWALTVAPLNAHEGYCFPHQDLWRYKCGRLKLKFKPDNLENSCRKTSHFFPDRWRWRWLLPQRLNSHLCLCHRNERTVRAEVKVRGITSLQLHYNYKFSLTFRRADCPVLCSSFRHHWKSEQSWHRKVTFPLFRLQKQRTLVALKCFSGRLGTFTIWPHFLLLTCSFQYDRLLDVLYSGLLHTADRG